MKGKERRSISGKVQKFEASTTGVSKNGQQTSTDDLNLIERWIAIIIIKKFIKKLNTMNMLGTSPKTSLVGWLSLIVALAIAGIALYDGDPNTKPDFQAIITALQALGVGIPLWLIGLFSRDNKVTSKQAGAEK